MSGSALAVALALGTLSGATASIVGFGIGSLLTPLFATWMGMDVAVAAVTLPHLFATALRCYRMRTSIDRGVLARFGLLSAGGGLAGALAYARLGPSALTVVLGALLVLTAFANLTGVFARMKPGGVMAACLGLASGFFGGIAGNQGGLRSAALGAFGLPPQTFVATSTATGLLVDLARTPVYAAVSAAELLTVRWPIVSATCGVLVGTLIGERILFGLSPATFRRLLSAAVGLLGVWLLATASCVAHDAKGANQIVLERTFSAPRERVFAALTQADQIPQWMKSTEMKLATCEVDLRVGGAFRYVFVRPSGRKLEVRGTYQEVESPRRIAHVETYDFSPLQILVTTTLEPAGETTRFRQVLQYSTKAERDTDYNGVVTSAAEAHDELERYLNQTGR